MSENTGHKSTHRIVIVGGGAAGLALASNLGRKNKRGKRMSIMLIDHQFTHVWKPLLHEVAAGSFDPDVNEISYLSQAKRCGFRFRLGSLSGIDRQNKRISLSPLYGDDGELLCRERTIRYDTLVLAVGSISNDFGVPGVSQHCLYMDSVEEATAFHRHLVKSYTRFFASEPSTIGSEAAGEHSALKVTIVGAGATGVELAAQLRQISDLLDSYVDTDTEAIHISVRIVEGADRVLPGLPEYLSAATAEQLARLDVKINTGEQVSEIRENVVLTKSGSRFASDMTVWAAGIKAPASLENSGDLELNRSGQVMVNKTLQSTVDDNIFAIGDCASCPWTEDKQIPPRAQSAHQQATFLVKGLHRHIEGKALSDFTYRDYGTLVSFGEFSTVGNLMGNVIKSVRIEGLFARLVYLSLYKMHQISLYGYIRTGLFTLSNIFRRSIHPEIKLH